VHVDGSKHCRARVGLAANLAARFKAHLTGLYAMPPATVSALMADQMRPDRLDDQATLKAQEREQLKGAFDAATSELGGDAEWLEGEGEASAVVALEARHADLTILSQADPSERLPSVAADLPERVVMDSGRPVLVIPYAGHFEQVGERVLVAWDGSPQAARAVKEALPLLEEARHVEVVTIGSPRYSLADLFDPGLDVVRHLAKHDVSAESRHLTASDGDIGNLLLSCAADEAADLIVMGAYGHSRLREIVFGGVSRTIFKEMTVPVLMTH
jgi:nucleotide-binding universal stress UspA family protein